MGRTACTEPQCLYKGDLYLYRFTHPTASKLRISAMLLLLSGWNYYYYDFGVASNGMMVIPNLVNNRQGLQKLKTGRTHAHTHAYADARGHTRAHTHTHTQAHTRADTHTRTLTHTHVYARTHTSTYARAHTHARVRTHTHAQKHIRARLRAHNVSCFSFYGRKVGGN